MADRDPTGRFVNGNRAAVKHGLTAARRSRKRIAKTAEMRALIQQTFPDLSALDDHTLTLLSVALADVALADEWIDRQGGPISDDGKILRVNEFRAARERTAIALLDRIGGSPKARAQLRAEAGTPGLAAHFAALRAKRALEAKK